MNDKTKGPLSALEDRISNLLNEHGKEIRTIADEVDAEDDGDMSETLDDIASEAKGHYGALAANEHSDDDDEVVISYVEEWVTNEISNSTTDRRVALAYAMLGRDEARRRLGQDPARTFKIAIDEIQHHRRIYIVDADSAEEALEKAERGETINEDNVKFVGVVSRDNAEIITE